MDIRHQVLLLSFRSPLFGLSQVCFLILRLNFETLFWKVVAYSPIELARCRVRSGKNTSGGLPEGSRTTYKVDYELVWVGDPFFVCLMEVMIPV